MDINNVIGQIEDILGYLKKAQKDQWIISKEQLEEWRDELQSVEQSNEKESNALAATNKDIENVQYVLSTDGSEKGVVIEETDYFCGMESCNGTVYRVEWPLHDGVNVTDCCSSGMKELENGDWQIL